MKVLHITPWFPNKLNPKEALWIKRHIEALDNYCDNYVWHVGTYPSDKFFQFKDKQNNVKHWILNLPTSKWVFVELVTLLQLLILGLFKRKLIKSVDVINFHIAYPSLTYWKVLKKILNKPAIITEHWSAYHFNFGVENPLPRVQNIFSHNIPVITVSEALKQDIIQFSKKDFPSYIIPNIVEQDVFFYDKNITCEQDRFFMVSQWKAPKDPIAIVNQFMLFLKIKPKAKLVIGGYGPLEEEIINLIKSENLSDNVSFIGKLSSKEIAVEMNKATAFIHLSNYETFSVVCAEAISCGCPVIASNVGGIVEFINDENGILIEDKLCLLEQIKKIDKVVYNREDIAFKARRKFCLESVGKLYHSILIENK